MPSGGCLPVAAKEEIIVSLDELENEAVRGALVSKSGSIDKCVAEESGSEEAPESDMDKMLDFCYVNDSCSSSESDMELGSAFYQTEVEDTGECSSYDVVVMKGLQDDLLEKTICISTLKSEGLLGGDQPIRTHTSAENMCTSSDNRCLKSCKVCNQSETTLKMLICDHCEEASHASCCNLRTTKILDGKWFCHSCLKKKHKILKGKTTSKSLNINSETGRCRKATSEGELGPIAFMLKGSEPYITSVQIGKDFQAEVPDWSGPIIDDVDTIESSQINPSEHVSLHELNLNNSSKLSSIGNWLQCQNVIDGVGDGVNGTICGKWRRAPLFEVQTDAWECFRTVLWDPVHADCAVPQELDTDQVLKHLKYIETLRHQLAAKRRKLGCTRSVGSQYLTGNVRNIRTQ
ncbi:uncharacterized protein LOC132279538 [Cornus florida]|uniref:uncharacterized protein LOC132279538 n=1 Tax=Cornus florida TaxID=4283 RepID=UPI002898F947|nr:uncharacterized protein LOC132279538 [Cornus florida]